MAGTALSDTVLLPATRLDKGGHVGTDPAQSTEQGETFGEDDSESSAGG